MTKMTGPKAVRKKNNYFCDVDATSARRWYWGRYHHGTKTINYLFIFIFSGQAETCHSCHSCHFGHSGPRNRVCWLFCSQK